MKTSIPAMVLLALAFNSVYAQETSVSAFKPTEVNWYNADLKDNQILETSVDKTYKELLANKKAKKTIIVAIIDSGVDINHEDLKGKIWRNEKEIPNNNIDDDHNGYIDDLYGWNFLGNAKGENINYENYEYTRIYKAGRGTKDYAAAKKLYEAELEKRTTEKANLMRFSERYTAAKNLIKEKTGIEVLKADDLSSITATDAGVPETVAFLKRVYANGFSEHSLEQVMKRNADFLDYYLNVDFNPRTIVGDNVEDINDNHYGNADVTGPRSDHGTGVAGIVAAIRGNGVGIDGVATDVKLMILRTTPNGDERDKDVALAIRYAVENGASIINMSFGKVFSSQRPFVDAAIKLAEQKNVLLIHAAGNEGVSIDDSMRYPSDAYSDGTEAGNFINVGANGMKADNTIACIFSNYGQKHVDIFAPGEDIVATDEKNTYSQNSGTSEAAPVVTGIAALVLSYYPELTPQQLIAILLDSATNLKSQKVLQPDLKKEQRDEVAFGELSKSGGVVNAYEAMKLAAAGKY
jgi:subtilisin family serine protease